MDTNTETADTITAPRPKGTTRNRKPTTKPKRRRGAPHKYIDVDTLGRTVGIEVTFVPGGYSEEEVRGTRGIFDDMTRTIARVFDMRLTKQYPAAKKLTHRCNIDPEVVEVSTMPVKTRRMLDKVLSAYYTVAGGLNLVPSYDWHGGGGAHIHVGRKKGEHKDMDAAMAMFATHHPYMTWAFMNPGDNNKNAKVHCALSLGSSDEDKAYHHEKLRESIACRNCADKRGSKADAAYYQTMVAKYLKVILAGNLAHRLSATQLYTQRQGKFGKGAAIARREIGKLGTWEFRLFRAPDTMEGHTRQLNFALAYTEYCDQLARAGKIPKPYIATLGQAHAAHPFPVAVAKFNKLLRTLGLDARKYRADIENMRRYYLINKLDMGTGITVSTTSTAVYTKPVCVKLPRRLFYRKHQRGVPATGERVKRSQSRAERKAAAERHAAYKASGIPRNRVCLKMGDTVTIMDGGVEVSTTITYVDVNDNTLPFRLANFFWVSTTGRTNENAQDSRDQYRVRSVNGVRILDNDGGAA